MTERMERYTEAWKYVRNLPWKTKMDWAEPNWHDHYRPVALDSLEQSLAGTGQGISSSDVNHVAMDEIQFDLIHAVLNDLWCPACGGAGVVIEHPGQTCPSCQGVGVTQNIVRIHDAMAAT